MSAVDAAEELVARCLSGDRQAFTALHRAFAPQLYRHLVLLLGSATDAEDALQTVFVQAFKNLHRFEGRSSVATWLHGIAINVSHNVRRSRRRSRHFLGRLTEFMSGARASPRYDERTHARKELSAVQQALDRLPPQRATAFALYYLAELDLPTIAQLLGCSQNTAWARISRGRTDLLRVMQRDPGSKTPPTPSTPNPSRSANEN